MRGNNPLVHVGALSTYLSGESLRRFIGVNAPSLIRTSDLFPTWRQLLRTFLKHIVGNRKPTFTEIRVLERATQQDADSHAFHDKIE